MSDTRKNLVTNSKRRQDFANSHDKKLKNGIPQERDTLTGLDKSLFELFPKLKSYEESGRSNADIRRALTNLTSGIKRQLEDTLGGTQTQSRSSGSTRSRSTKGKGKSKKSSSSAMDGSAPIEPSAEKVIRTAIGSIDVASSDSAGEQGGSDIPDYSWINNFTRSYSLQMFEEEMRSLSKDTSAEQVRRLLGVFEAFGASLALDAASTGKSKAKAKAKSKSKAAGTSTDPPASLSQDARMFLSRPRSDSGSSASSAQIPHLSLHTHPLAGLLMWARDGTLDEATIEEGSAVEETDHEEEEQEE